MFDEAGPEAHLLVQQAQALGDRLARFDGRGDAARDLVALIAALEDLKCRAEGAQVMASAALDRVQRDEQSVAEVPAAQQGKGLGLQVALARRESHHRGRQHLGLATVLTNEMPCTLQALRAGRISEWRATLVARETACLSREHRGQVDRLLGDGDALHRASDRGLVGELRRMTYRLDAESVVSRRRRAESDRGVWLRPAPDTMTYLTALLPVVEGVGVYAALTRAADTARAAGDERSRGQVMADLLVTRALGQPGGRPQVPVMVNVVVSDQVLLGGSDTDGPGEVDGYGPVPGSLVRDLATGGPRAAVALRRLYARPADGGLVAMDSRSRCFPAGLAELIRLRDRTCRMPWCDAPIRHIDHVRPVADAGSTAASNGQGLCEACNHAKQARGWTQEVVAGPHHDVVTKTPTGERHRSRAPVCPRPAAVSQHPPDHERHEPRRDLGGREGSLLELAMWRHLHAA